MLVLKEDFDAGLFHGIPGVFPRSTRNGNALGQNLNAVPFSQGVVKGGFYLPVHLHLAFGQHIPHGRARLLGKEAEEGFQQGSVLRRFITCHTSSNNLCKLLGSIDLNFALLPRGMRMASSDSQSSKASVPTYSRALFSLI